MIIATDIQVWADDLRDWVDMNPGPEPVVFMHVTAQGPYPWTSATQYFRNVTERYDRRDPAHSFQAHANTWIQDWVNANLGPGKWDILGRLIRVEPCPGPMRLTVLDRADWRRMNYIVLDQGR